MFTLKQYIQLAIVVLSGCILTAVLLQQIQIESSNILKFILQYAGPVITGWAIIKIITKWNKPKF